MAQGIFAGVKEIQGESCPILKCTEMSGFII